MKNIEVLNKTWLLPQTIHKTMCGFYRALSNTYESVLLDVNKNPLPAANEVVKGYDVINGVAVIDITGVLTKGLTFFSFLFGGSSMQQIAAAYLTAIADPQVNSVLLAIDSPGGTVDGTQDLANIIYSGKKGKPVFAYSDGMVCSAAYWIASAADKIFISGDTIQVGSIGVVAAHVDISKADEMEGEKYTEITAGKYKRIAGNHTPLQNDGRQYLQESVDYIYSVFIENVARNRNVSERQALAMADGKVFLGQQAVDIGLVDGIANFDEVIQILAPSDANPLAIPKQNKKSGKTFESIVFAYCASGMNQAQSFNKSKNDYPKLYEDWTVRLRAGNVGELFPGAIRGGKVQK